MQPLKIKIQGVVVWSILVPDRCEVGRTIGVTRYLNETFRKPHCDTEKIAVGTDLQDGRVFSAFRFDHVIDHMIQFSYIIDSHSIFMRPPSYNCFHSTMIPETIPASQRFLTPGQHFTAQFPFP